MVLVDTSVWIRALSNQEPYASELYPLLIGDKVAGHDLVYGELLIGDKGGRKGLLTAYVDFHQASTVAHQEVVTLVNTRRLHGRGVSWIDVHLLASALVDGLKLWSADERLSGIAAEFGVAYRPKRS